MKFYFDTSYSAVNATMVTKDSTFIDGLTAYMYVISIGVFLRKIDVK